MPYHYLVPQDTQRVLQRRVGECLNMGLILGRYIPDEVIHNQDVLNDQGRVVGKERGEWLPKLCAQLNPYHTDKQALADLIVASQDRWIARTQGAARFELELLTPLVVGLGGKGPLEFGITLSHITGLPTIPGSALKGLCRSYALLSLAAVHGIPIETKALDTFDEQLLAGEIDGDEAFAYRVIFGTQQVSGACVFHEAVMGAPPDQQPIFRVDVMTPHFVEYYTSQAHEPPHDADNPNPVLFLTVTPGTRFSFAVGIRGAAPDLAKSARRWLRAALKELGIGSKTAAGYGAFGELPK